MKWTNFSTTIVGRYLYWNYEVSLVTVTVLPTNRPNRKTTYWARVTLTKLTSSGDEFYCLDEWTKWWCSPLPATYSHTISGIALQLLVLFLTFKFLATLLQIYIEHMVYCLRIYFVKSVNSKHILSNSSSLRNN